MIEVGCFARPMLFWQATVSPLQGVTHPHQRHTHLAKDRPLIKTIPGRES
jgi:hypothetical protein